MSWVVKKIRYSIALRFPMLNVDVLKELSESELRQFYSEIRRLESAVADQLGTFASVIAAPSPHAKASRDNMEKVLQYARGKPLFKASEVQVDLGISKDVVYPAVARLFADKKLARFKLRLGGAFGY